MALCLTAAAVAARLPVLAQVAAAVTGEGRQWAVWDESFSTWGFAGTPALPKGTVLLNWQAPDQASEAAAALPRCAGAGTRTGAHSSRPRPPALKICLQIANMTSYGYQVVAAPFESAYLDCGEQRGWRAGVGRGTGRVMDESGG